MTTKNIHCHKMIRAVAIEMAGEIYDQVMRDNKVYAHYKSLCPDLTPTLNEIMFIELMWPHLIGQARATLASMLDAKSGAVLTQAQKDEIHDALVKDNTLQRGRHKSGAVNLTKPIEPRIEGGKVVYH